MLSELPDTAPVDDSVAKATAPVAAQETAPEASTPVVNTSVQFTSLHSSWSQPTLPCPAWPTREGQRVCQQVRHCCTGPACPPTSPWIEPPKAPKCSFVTLLQARRCSRRFARACRGRSPKLEAVPSLYRQPKE